VPASLSKRTGQRRRCLLRVAVKTLAHLVCRSTADRQRESQKGRHLVVAFGVAAKTRPMAVACFPHSCRLTNHQPGVSVGDATAFPPTGTKPARRRDEVDQTTRSVVTARTDRPASPIDRRTEFERRLWSRSCAERGSVAVVFRPIDLFGPLVDRPLGRDPPEAGVDQSRSRLMEGSEERNGRVRGGLG